MGAILGSIRYFTYMDEKIINILKRLILKMYITIVYSNTSPCINYAGSRYLKVTQLQNFRFIVNCFYFFKNLDVHTNHFIISFKSLYQSNYYCFHYRKKVILLY